MARAVLTVGVLSLLLGSLLVGIAPNLDARVVQLGESVWPGYAASLRADPAPPGCELEPLRARLETCSTKAPSELEPAAEADPFAPPDAGDEPEDCEALANLVNECSARHERFTAEAARVTSGVRRFRAVELALADLAQFAGLKHVLVLVVLLAAIVTALARQHLSLRNAQTATEHRFSEVVQLAAHGSWLVSCVADRNIQLRGQAELENPLLPVLWAVGFGVLAAINLWHLVRLPANVTRGPTTLLRLVTVVPLYAVMALLSSAYFLLVEHHPSGQAVYLHKFTQLPATYIGVGLYVWAGMLLAKTALARLGFGVVAPFQLPPALLGWLVMVLGAYPVAYSGASGVFVIAVGAVIYQQLRAAGAPRRMAVAATAMAGSLGVVLRPCLIVLLITMLNKQVTTDELYDWGRWVFVLTAALSFLAFWAWSRLEPTVLLQVRRPWREAVPESLSALRPLVPSLLIAAGVVSAYSFGLDTVVNEHTAPFVLPVVMLALLAWDRLGFKRPELEPAVRGVWPAVRGATDESAHHVGALLMMMCGSVALGGLVERSEVMRHMPASIDSVWASMTVIVVLLVLIGMAMDELGAVVLVSVSIAPFAAAQGIHPVHFWMVVLVGFELGYLAPPVALNQLLARQVVGRDAEVETSDPKVGFIARFAHVIVPCAIMGVALLLVAYGPLIFLPK